MIRESKGLLQEVSVGYVLWLRGLPSSFRGLRWATALPGTVIPTVQTLQRSIFPPLNSRRTPTILPTPDTVRGIKKRISRVFRFVLAAVFVPTPRSKRFLPKCADKVPHRETCAIIGPSPSQTRVDQGVQIRTPATASVRRRIDECRKPNVRQVAELAERFFFFNAPRNREAPGTRARCGSDEKILRAQISTNRRGRDIKSGKTST